MKILTARIRNRYLILTDILSCMLSYIMFTLLVYPTDKLFAVLVSNTELIILTALIYVFVLVSFSLYRIDWLNAGVKEYILLLSSTILSAIISFIVCWLFPCYIHPKLNIAINIGIFGLICASRFFIRLASKFTLTGKNHKDKRTLIIGAGRLAVLLLHDITQSEELNYHVVGLIDDDVKKSKQIIYGTKVIGTTSDIEKICKTHNVEEIIFSIFNISPDKKAEILDSCSNTGKKVKILSGLSSQLNASNRLKMIREIDINDLLERNTITLDNKLIARDIRGKTILVTGGSGSIGSELCRQIVKFSPGRLIVLDIYENTTYDLQNELEEEYPDQVMDFIIASVRDKERLNRIFEKYSPDIVFHAAAHKHVPLMEFNPSEAIKNNILGTYNTAVCAKEYNAKKFVLISTDKAVNPTNIMGASKRVCEMIIQSMADGGTTDFAAVRFGNVLGSNGSVIPRFKKQIAEGGPVTVTHPEITRFFMTIPEASQLVLQAAAYARGGEIFVLDMGTPVKIYDLAKKMIKLSGLVPGEDIEISFTGLRPGEKLYEELLMNEEGLKTTEHSKIFVGQPIDISKEILLNKLETLKSAINSEDDNEVKRIMEQVVPTYRITPNSKDEEKTDEKVLINA